MEIMKKCILSLMIVIGLILGDMMPVKAEKIKPFKESNSSYLFAQGNGYERVKVYPIDDDHAKLGGVVIEKYSSDFQLLSQKSLDLNDIAPTGSSLNKLYSAKVYEGSQYNFILTSQFNQHDDKNMKTIRVTRYTKDWDYSANVELDAAQNNVEVYDASVESGNMMEYNGQLWVSIGHEGFSMSGVHHQGKLNFIININDMSFVSSASDLNHSFSQYLTTCNGEIYQMELAEGDRCVYAEKLDSKEYTGGWSANRTAGSSSYKNIFTFYSLNERPGGMWAYVLGGSTSGFASSNSSSRLLSSGNAVNQDKLKANVNDSNRKDEVDSDLSYNAWVSSTSTDFQSSDVKYLTSFPDGGDTQVSSGPYLIKEDDHKFLAVWGISSTLTKNYSDDGQALTYGQSIVSTDGDADEGIAKKIKDSRKIQYCFLNEYGDKISQVKDIQGKLNVTSLARLNNGDVSWCSGEGGSPIFYTIHSDGTSRVIDTNPTYDLKNVVFKDKTIVYDGKSHTYPKVKNLPAGVKVKYTNYKVKNNEKIEDNLSSDQVTGVSKNIVYAYFYCDDPYAKLLNDQPRVAHLIIIAKDINKVKVKVTMGKKEVKYIDLSDGRYLLYYGFDYNYVEKGHILTIKGIRNYKGSFKINLKTGKVMKASQSAKKKVPQIKSSMKNVKSDEGPKGTTYQKLQLKYLTANDHSIKVGWKSIKGCQYDIYMAQCGKTFKKIKATTKYTYTFKKLKKKTFYKILVVAKKGQKNISLSKSVHIYTGKGNATKVKVNISKKIKKGKVLTYKVQSNQKVRKHRSIQCESSNLKVLKVTKKGIKALKKGKATLYIYEQDGISQKCTVTIQ